MRSPTWLDVQLDLPRHLRLKTQLSYSFSVIAIFIIWSLARMNQLKSQIKTLTISGSQKNYKLTEERNEIVQFL